MTTRSVTTSLLATAETGDDPEARFRNIIEAIALHMTYRIDPASLDSELRYLDPASRAHYAALRDEVQSLLAAAINDGVRRGVFRVAYATDTTRALLGMLQAIANWYHIDGPITPQQLAQRYVEIAVNTFDAGRARRTPRSKAPREVHTPSSPSSNTCQATSPPNRTGRKPERGKDPAISHSTVSAAVDTGRMNDSLTRSPAQSAMAPQASSGHCPSSAGPGSPDRGEAAEFVDEDVGGDRALDETAKACADERRAAAPHAVDGGPVNGRGCDRSVRAEG